MTINWETFTPEMSFLGGTLIGLAALILMFVNDRVMGVSAIFGVEWGLDGLCPGPVVASLFLNPNSIVPFLLIMLMGLRIGSLVKSKL